MSQLSLRNQDVSQKTYILFSSIANSPNNGVTTASLATNPMLVMNCSTYRYSKNIQIFYKTCRHAVVQIVLDDWWVPMGPTTLEYEKSTYDESYNFIAQAEDLWIPKL